MLKLNIRNGVIGCVVAAAFLGAAAYALTPPGPFTLNDDSALEVFTNNTHSLVLLEVCSTDAKDKPGASKTIFFHVYDLAGKPGSCRSDGGDFDGGNVHVAQCKHLTTYCSFGVSTHTPKTHGTVTVDWAPKGAHVTAAH